MLSSVLGDLTDVSRASYLQCDQSTCSIRARLKRTGYSHVGLMVAYIHRCAQFTFKHLQKQEVEF